MFEDQQRQGAELSLQCLELERSSAQSQARTSFLEALLEAAGSEVPPCPAVVH